MSLMQDSDYDYIFKLIHADEETPLKERNKTIKEFLSLSQAITSDERVSYAESKAILAWMEENEDLSSRYPLKQLRDRLFSASEDGSISEDESTELVQILKSIGRGDFNTTKKKKEELPCGLELTYDELGADFRFSGHSFCLSGNFAGSKSSLTAMIAEKGGEIKTAVSEKLDFLIVGLTPSEEWKFGTYGLKIDKALKIRSCGSFLRIHSEGQIIEFLLKR